VLGVVEALSRTPRGPGGDTTWFAVGPRVFRRPALLIFCAVLALPGLLFAVRAGGLVLGVRLAQSALFALLLWRHPVPAAWVLAWPAFTTALPAPRWLTLGLGVLPGLALAGLGVAAYARGFVSGTWLSAWEAGLLVLALALLFIPLGAKGRGPAKRWKGKKTGRKRTPPAR
jgi:hypothetical protein